MSSPAVAAIDPVLTADRAVRTRAAAIDPCSPRTTRRSSSPAAAIDPVLAADHAPLKPAGDALYATLVLFAIGFAWSAIATGARWDRSRVLLRDRSLAGVHAAWLDAVRTTLPARLVLGQGFHAFALVCYVLEALYRAAASRRR